MAKVKGPLFSFNASGSLGKAIVYSAWRGVAYVRELVIPGYSRTVGQGKLRDIIKDASHAWQTGATVGAVVIDSSYKTAYNDAAMGRAMSGFNMFIRDCVAKNNGIAYDGSLEAPTEPGDITP